VSYYLEKTTTNNLQKTLAGCLKTASREGACQWILALWCSIALITVEKHFMVNVTSNNLDSTKYDFA